MIGEDTRELFKIDSYDKHKFLKLVISLKCEVV